MFRKKLWRIFDLARGYMEVEHILELVTYLAMIAKFAPLEYKQILNSGTSRLYRELVELGESVQHTFNLPAEICTAPESTRLDIKMLPEIVRLVSDFFDYHELNSILQELTQQAGKRGSMVGANKNTEQIFIHLIGDCSNKTVYDGACGMAQIASALNAERIVLEEIHPISWVLAFRLLLLKDKEFELSCGDSLLNTDSREHFADIVAMEPPMSLKFPADMRRILANVDYLRVHSGDQISATAGDALWIQKALSKMNAQGKAYLLLPQGWLFRGGYDAKVRKYLLEHELIEAIIGLPAGILDFTGIPPMILILNNHRPSGTPVVFVDAHEIGAKVRHRHEISEAEAQLIADLVASKYPKDARYKAVHLPEIRSNENNLNIQRYIQKLETFAELNPKEEMAKLAALRNEYEISQARLNTLLSQFDQHPEKMN